MWGSLQDGSLQGISLKGSQPGLEAPQSLEAAQGEGERTGAWLPRKLLPFFSADVSLGFIKTCLQLTGSGWPREAVTPWGFAFEVREGCSLGTFWGTLLGISPLLCFLNGELDVSGYPFLQLLQMGSGLSSVWGLVSSPLQSLGHTYHSKGQAIPSPLTLSTHDPVEPCFLPQVQGIAKPPSLPKLLLASIRRKHQNLKTHFQG